MKDAPTELIHGEVDAIEESKGEVIDERGGGVDAEDEQAEASQSGEEGLLALLA